MTPRKYPLKNRPDRWHEPGCGLGIREDLVEVIGTERLDVHILHHLAALIQEHCCPTSPFRAHRLAWGWRRVDDAVDAMVEVRERNGKTGCSMTTALWRQWEEGRHRPAHGYQEDLCELFSTSAVKLGFAPDFSPKPDDPLGAGSGNERFRRVILAGQGWDGRSDEETPTDRRSFFGAAGFTFAAGPVLTGPNLMYHALDLGSVSPDRLNWIENETEQIAYQAKHLANLGPLLKPATEHFNYVSALIAHPQRTADRVRLVRCASNLAGALGQVTFDYLGDYALSRSWYEACRSAALDIGDPYLADMGLTGLVWEPMYEGNPAGVLEAIRDRLENPPADPNLGIAKLYGIAARAHATMGDRSESDRNLDHARETFERSPEPDIRVWQEFDEATLEYHTANAASQLGDVERATEAADRAIELFDPDVNDTRTLARFDKARALRLRGEVEESCRVAIRALQDPNMYFGTAIKTRAEEFDRNLGQTTGAVREFRDAFHTLKARSERLDQD